MKSWLGRGEGLSVPWEAYALINEWLRGMVFALGVDPRDGEIEARFLRRRQVIDAIGAADAALKAGNVHLIGYETTGGRGRIVLLKFEGDVDAVNAAMDSARAAAAAIGEVLRYAVIPRPAEGTEGLVRSADNIVRALTTGGT